jgi:hypothetical protein
MGVLADTLGGKTSGELIRASDWNSLIDAIEAIEATLNTRITDLSNSVDARFGVVDTALATLQANVDELSSRVDDIDATVEALRQRFRNVTLETAQTEFVIGELAQITARVTDLDGTPLPAEAGRPWIDFVAVWGQLKPVAGFESRGGAGDRTISVRVNADGIARVLLRAEHAEGFSDEAEAEVAAALTTIPAGATRSVKDSILFSSTPMEARESGAFRILSAEYSRTDALNVRDYADAYYVKNPTLAASKFVPNFHHRWRDYRATVMAFAKTDSDPRTPDPALGTCSIQVTFRDWIGPWINLDFFEFEEPILIPQYRDRFRGRITPDYKVTLGRWQQDVGEILEGKGILGRQKHGKAIKDALNQIEVTNPPSFLFNLTEVVGNGLTFQQATEFTQAAAIGGGTEPLIFQAFTESASHADTRAAEVEAGVGDQLTQEFSRARDEILFEVEREQANFRNELFAENGTIQGVQREILTVSGQIQGFQTALNGKADVQTLARFLQIG